jgi:hypothetical protein
VNVKETSQAGPTVVAHMAREDGRAWSQTIGAQSADGSSGWLVAMTRQTASRCHVSNIAWSAVVLLAAFAATVAIIAAAAGT